MFSSYVYALEKTVHVRESSSQRDGACVEYSVYFTYRTPRNMVIELHLMLCVTLSRENTSNVLPLYCTFHFWGSEAAMSLTTFLLFGCSSPLTCDFPLAPDGMHLVTIR